jgi:hypothetical protein
MSLVVMDRNLNLRPWDAGQHKEHPEAGLHCGFGSRLDKLKNAPKPSDALGARVLGGITAEFGDVNQAGMEDQIRSDHTFCQWISSSEVDHRTERGRRGQRAPQHDLVRGEIGAADRRAGKAAAADRFWNGDLDWIAGRHVKSVQPGCGATGEGSASR